MSSKTSFLKCRTVYWPPRERWPHLCARRRPLWLAEVGQELWQTYQKKKKKELLQVSEAQGKKSRQYFHSLDFISSSSLFLNKLRRDCVAGEIVLIFKAGKLDVVAEPGFVTLDERLDMIRNIRWESLNLDGHPILEPAASSSNQNYVQF